jgi:glycosyltransferase involved in cell wall biosynthesis
MKLLTVAIPCYNSQDYMEHAVETALVGGEDVEIILVNDGSSDKTAEIADRLQKEHPTIVRAIHQENGGHGAAVNTGLANASGLYYKVLDSDDWFDRGAFLKILDVLRSFVEDGSGVDMLLANYVYEKPSLHKHKVIRYDGVFPENQVFTWNDVKRFKISQNILMHSVIYRTKMLRDCQLELPRHTFYVDNIFVYNPLPFVKKMYYVNADLYRYFIGRKEQSMNMDNFVRNQEHHKKMIKWLIEYYTHISSKLSSNKREYIEIILTYTLNTHYSIYCEYDKDHARAYKEIVDFDQYLLKVNKALYERINCMAYIRYNRKTKFKFVRLNGRKWNTAMKMARRLKGKF